MVVPSLWSCRFVLHPHEFPLDHPFVLLEDERVDPGSMRLLSACGGQRFAGPVLAPGLTPEGYRLVISSRDWPELAGSALRSLDAERIVILLHLDHDPHGYWDFALGGDGGPGLGASLDRVIAARSVDADSFADVARHADHWMASRTKRGRISAGAHHIMKHYPAVVAGNAGRLVTILAGLADQKSRDVLTRVLFGTAEQILDGYVAQVFGPQQYMEIIRIRPGDTIINGGVETGWELPYFIALMRGEGRIHSFDPIFQIAGRWAEPSARAFASMLTDHEVALVETDRPVRLAVEPGFGTAYASGDDSETLERAGLAFRDYEGRALDALVAEGKIGPFTVVKLDVEGGELAALHGMSESLRRFRPRLAVAIYHEPEHFFEIPAYLMQLLADYRFYIRQYSCGRFETLLYAVPNEDVAGGSGEEFGLAGVAPSSPPGTDVPVVVTAYRQDSTPRLTHRGEVSQLDRANGGNWAFVDLSAVARVDGLKVLSVTEAASPGFGHLVAQTPGTLGRDAIFVGELVAPLSIAWRAGREVAAGSFVPVVGLAPEVAIIAEYIGAEDALYVYRLGENVTEGVTTIRSIGMTPLALHPGEGEGRIRLLGRAGDAYRLVETTFAPGAPRQDIGAMIAGSAAFRAVCMVTDYTAAPALRAYGYVFSDGTPEEVHVFVPSEAGGFRPLRKLDWPDDTIVSTGMPTTPRPGTDPARAAAR